MKELNIEAGNANKEQGIERAANHAEANHSGWADMALGYVKRYPGEKFMAEDVRMWAYANGLPLPPSERAWGGVIRTAVKLGMVKHAGYGSVKNPKAHRTPASVWEKYVVGNE